MFVELSPREVGASWFTAPEKASEAGRRTRGDLVGFPRPRPFVSCSTPSSAAMFRPTILPPRPSLAHAPLAVASCAGATPRTATTRVDARDGRRSNGHVRPSLPEARGGL